MKIKSFTVMSVVLYSLFLIAWLFAAYFSCGKELLSMPGMRAVQGVLLHIDRVGQPMGRSNARVHVEYEFLFAERVFRGRHIAACTGSYFAGSAVDSYSRFYEALKGEAGNAVTVWVDPASPETNYLFKHVPRWWLLIFAFLLALGSAACYSVLRWVRLVFSFKE